MSFDSGRLSHAYITDDSFADTLAMAVVCSAHDTSRPCRSCRQCDKVKRFVHPDIITVEKLDNKQIISVDQIRELKQGVLIVPNNSEKKAYIIKDADAMNINAQNALLQILEEPPGHTVFILSTDNPAALLPTVRSRCVELKSMSGREHTGGEHTEDITYREELEELVGEFIKALAGDNVKLIKCMFSIDKLEKPDLYDFFALARLNIVLTLRENLVSGSKDKQKKLIHAESVLTEANEMLDLNVSAGHISGFICASMIN